MKTIFIPIFQGAEAKNILRTNIYKFLIADPDLRLVFFVGDENKAEYYKREFHHERVIYEVVPAYGLSLADRLVDFLKFKLIKTKTLDLRRKMALEDTGNYFAYAFSFLLNRLLAHRLLRRIVRGADYFFVKREIFRSFFEKYNPDAVFLAHLFDDLEAAMLREAKKRKIPSIAFINSWDKLTARGMLRLLPDKMIVFNELVKQEAVDCADMNPENVFVSGLPQYDQYFQPRVSSREEFYRRLKIDPSKRILVYAPIGKYFSNSDWDILDLLHEWFEKKLIPEDVEMLVRFQPNDFLDEEEIKKRPWLKYDYPGVRFSKKRGVDWDMSFADLQHLTDTLYYSSLFVCYATSLSVDAAVFDKPVINIDFEVKEKQKLSQTATHFYKTAHYAKAARTGGIRFVKSKEELLEWINKYLTSPALDRDGRRQLVAEQCWKIDGQTGERVVKIILNSLKI